MQLALPSPTWFCSFSGPGAETLPRPRCYLQGGNARREEVTLGVRSLFPQFCPMPGTGAFCPGDHLHLAIHCSATVFSCLSVSLLHLPRNFPTSHHPVSFLGRTQSLVPAPAVYAQGADPTLDKCPTLSSMSCSVRMLRQGGWREEMTG